MSAAARAAMAAMAAKDKPARPNWAVAGICLGLATAAARVYVLIPWTAVLQWAVQGQREFQNAMAGFLRDIRGGDRAAIFALCGATAAYGFVHALGPGHGKVLLGGVALASGATLRRMAMLTLISSLMQAVLAIVLVAGAAQVLGWASRDLVGLSEQWLAPASALAMAGIGAILLVRGARAWRRGVKTEPLNTEPTRGAACGCGHAHGPSLSEVTSLSSAREAAALVATIAIRPCTGALLVLVIALRMDIFMVGCVAVLTMGLGTAAFNLIIATSGVTARRLAALPLESHKMKQFSAGIHIVGGALIALISLGLVSTSFTSVVFPLK